MGTTFDENLITSFFGDGVDGIGGDRGSHALHLAEQQAMTGVLGIPDVTDPQQDVMTLALAPGGSGRAGTMVREGEEDPWTKAAYAGGFGPPFSSFCPSKIDPSVSVLDTGIATNLKTVTVVNPGAHHVGVALGRGFGEQAVEFGRMKAEMLEDGAIGSPVTESAMGETRENASTFTPKKEAVEPNSSTFEMLTPRKRKCVFLAEDDVDSSSQKSADVKSVSSKSAAPETRDRKQLKRVEIQTRDQGKGKKPLSMQKKDTHNSHTKRCRDKVNQKFRELISILPAAPADVEVKHKAQILDYTINVFKRMNMQAALLEARLALSSKTSLSEWVTSKVKKATSLRDALDPFLSLMCTKERWKCGEVWYTHKKGGDRSALTLNFGFCHIPRVVSTEDESSVSHIKYFLEESRRYSFEQKEGVPGRVVCTMRPEWLPRLDEPEVFVRAQLAVKHGMQVCCGIPVVVCGNVAAVAVFFDTVKREYDPSVIDLAHDVASNIGNAYGAYKGPIPELSGQSR